MQMEFCEKSTLRDCIDAGLHRDVSRVWQLFREIIEGLVHIHDQVHKRFFIERHDKLFSRKKFLTFDIVCERALIWNHFIEPMMSLTNNMLPRC